MNIKQERGKKKKKKLAKKNVTGFGKILLVRFSPQFFLHFGERIFGEFGEKTPRPHLLFSFFPI